MKTMRMLLIAATMSAFTFFASCDNEDNPVSEQQVEPQSLSVYDELSEQLERYSRDFILNNNLMQPTRSGDDNSGFWDTVLADATGAAYGFSTGHGKWGRIKRAIEKAVEYSALAALQGPIANEFTIIESEEQILCTESLWNGFGDISTNDTIGVDETFVGYAHNVVLAKVLKEFDGLPVSRILGNAEMIDEAIVNNMPSWDINDYPSQILDPTAMDIYNASVNAAESYVNTLKLIAQPPMRTLYYQGYMSIIENSQISEDAKGSYRSTISTCAESREFWAEVE